ncbi:hypothetical protein [Parafrankia sp. EUN1f]|uniref:hypothetical protein n=1 Tax=Parafrankia sp. EUN1f TaxID=102897 RepID=UPI0001C46D22|nr:hypothetical protein [Parafrankia sp. EUN1f]EFC80080.1 hypothetical protein FrEUN1fDRAFT_6807 [Parafrankia sp. EUN1f]
MSVVDVRRKEWFAAFARQNSPALAPCEPCLADLAKPVAFVGSAGHGGPCSAQDPWSGSGLTVPVDHLLRNARRAAAQFRARNPHLIRSTNPRLTARYWRTQAGR